MVCIIQLTTKNGTINQTLKNCIQKISSRQSLKDTSPYLSTKRKKAQASFYIHWVLLVITTCLRENILLNSVNSVNKRHTFRYDTIFDNWKPFKSDEKCFLFHLKSSFFNINLNFIINFKIYDITVATNILTNISRSKGHNIQWNLVN